MRWSQPPAPDNMVTDSVYVIHILPHNLPGMFCALPASWGGGSAQKFLYIWFHLRLRDICVSNNFVIFELRLKSTEDKFLRITCYILCLYYLSSKTWLAGVLHTPRIVGLYLFCKITVTISEANTKKSSPLAPHIYLIPPINVPTNFYISFSELCSYEKAPQRQGNRFTVSEIRYSFS